MNDFQMLISSESSEEEKYELPSYKDPGSVVFINHGTPEPYGNGDKSVYQYDIEILDYDSDSSILWIQEGEGLEYWIDQLDLPGPGVYVIENITGTYYRGDWGFDDDDVEWNHDEPKLAKYSDMPFRSWWREFLLLFGYDPIMTIKTVNNHMT